jgi:formate hydrogenlyase transcriptional activator
MFPLISPRVPANRVVFSSRCARQGVRVTRSFALRVARQLLLFLLFFAISAIWFSSVLAKATTPVEVEMFLVLHNWIVLAGVATFLVQAVLIIWLLMTRVRRREAQGESRRLETLADSGYKRLNEVVSNVPGIVWEARLDPITHELTATFISDYAEKMLGYTVKECLSTPQFALQLVHEDDRERFSQEAAAVFSGGPALLQFRLRAKDSRTVWAEAHVDPQLDKTGTIIGIRGVTLDVTARHLAETARMQSEETFARSFRTNPQPMSIVTLADGVFVDINESFLTMSGYPREEVIGHTALQLGIWKTKEQQAEFINELNRVGSIGVRETRFLTKDGSTRFLLSSTEKLDFVGEECFLIASTDITERVAAQEALQESEERFRNMADATPIMIWMSGPDQGCSYFNQQWLDFTGRTMDEELGSGWAERIYPEDYIRCLDVYSKSFDLRKPFEMEYRLRRSDGEYRWVYDKGTPCFSTPDHVFLGYIGSCLDITERKESEVSLRTAHEELNRMKNQLEAENTYLQQELQRDSSFGEIVGESDAIKYVLFKVTQVAPTDTTVLITGETGTGKELVALAIQEASARKDRPLIKVNCAALSPNLIESDLFGHEKGAFTGAGARKPGRFELADRGTIFLDEIGELPLELQVKLLRVIQENEFERLGGTKTIKSDVRIIAATNRDLKLEVEKGNFREDLWYRLNVYPITVPPLRQRKEDIPLLVEHFVNGYAKKFGKTITSVSPKSLQRLQAHSWPGNVRELANVIERAVIHAKGSVLQLVDHFEIAVEAEPFSTKTLGEIEREYIMETLEHTGWRIEGPSGAANILGLNPSTLRTRMLKLGIHRRHTHVPGASPSHSAH